MQGTAQLTGTTGVITTAGHIFYNSDGLARFSRTLGCRVDFSTSEDSLIQTCAVNLDSLTVGTPNPGPANRPGDWAVARLSCERSLERLLPFLLSDLLIPTNLDNRRSLAVTSQQLDFPLSVPNGLQHVIHWCGTRGLYDIDNEQQTQIMVTDCDLGSGGSGGALALRHDNGRVYLAGVFVASTEDERSGAAFDQSYARSIVVPLDGRFKEAVVAYTEGAMNDLAVRLASTGTEILRGLFEPGAASFAPGATATLEALAAALLRNPPWRVGIVGHTDAAGGEAANLLLSQRRAIAVRDYLVAAGVDAGRLDVAGYGEAVPIATNDTAAGRDANRRIEIVGRGPLLY